MSLTFFQGVVNGGKSDGGSPRGSRESVCGSDVIFPGTFQFPKNRDFPRIQPNFPGIPENLLKATFSHDL